MYHVYFVVRKSPFSTMRKFHFKPYGDDRPLHPAPTLEDKLEPLALLKYVGGISDFPCERSGVNETSHPLEINYVHGMVVAYNINDRDCLRYKLTCPLFGAILNEDVDEFKSCAVLAIGVEWCEECSRDTT